jgi:predicted molibdopterin-dependent oxidoreductase YjgC
MITPDRTIHTTCPYCGVGCQIDLHIKNEMVYRVDGRFDNDVNNGKLCVKGRFGYDYIHAPDRLVRPLVRSDQLVRCSSEQVSSSPHHLIASSWDSVLNTIAQRLQETREKYGPDSIAILASAKCTNEENYLLQKFARAVIGTNNVDHCARL